MKRFLRPLLTPGLAAGLFFVALLPTAQAIKIVVPDQYQEQVDSAKAAERAERERELDVEGQKDSAADAGSAGVSELGISQPSEQAAELASDDFVMQSVVEAETAAAAFEGTLAEDQGLVSGQVLDQESGAPVAGAAIIIEGTNIATVTGADGRYSLGPVSAGKYTLSFIKTGYIEANITEYQIAGGEISVFPFALPPRPADMSDEVYELQDFTVTAEEANQMMLALDLRMSSDSIMNVMTSEDFSRFAASDVGDAIKRVAGITVEGGKFAVIRGLDERYSSTTLNGVPVPSPDPDRQSVPLDLFPSEIVGNLGISKTFTPDLPGNSAGGSINIQTSAFPEEWEIKIKAGTGFNENAEDRFISRDGPEARQIDWNPDTLGLVNFGRTTANAGMGTRDKDAGTERDFGLDFGGTSTFFDRDIRVVGSFSTERAFSTLTGTEETRFGRAQINGSPTRPRFPESGDLIQGRLPLTNGRFDLIESEFSERDTYLLSSEIDIDTESEHRAHVTYFRNDNSSEIASARENGFFPDFEKGTFTDQQLAEFTPYVGTLIEALSIAGITQPAGPSFQDLNDSFLDARLFTTSVLDQERSLEVFQYGTTHKPTNFLDGLELSWTYSDATATQDDIDAVTLQSVQGVNGNFIIGQAPEVSEFFPFFGWRRVLEEQSVLRVDGAYTFDFGDNLKIKPGIGTFRERTDRETEQLVLPLVPISFGAPAQFGGSPTLQEAALIGLGPFPGTAGSSFRGLAEGERDVDAHYFSVKITLFEKFDLFAGVRNEKVLMTSGTNEDSGADFFNSDLLSDAASGATPANAQINTQILGINDSQPLPVGFVGKIDEKRNLPAISLSYRPFEGARITAAYSETMVRPSFKEFTYITVQNPITLDFESGNPTLKVSDVKSMDLRLEYVRPNGDLLAVSFFHKTIDDPIEKTSLRGFAGNTDIFFNNENQAELQGIELEGRKSLDFLGNDFLQYFSVGGNVTLIDATVGIPENFRKLLSGGLQVDIDGRSTTLGGNAYAVKTGEGLFDGEFAEPPSERPLFQQPEWIANTDITFEQPDWGTRATLSVFAQSKVLDRAGGFERVTGQQRVSVDEYRKAFHEVNFTFSQRLNDYLSLSFSVKNLTDSERGIEYDEIIGGDRRSFKVGRDYSIALTGTF